ncbi:hypothetical protein ETU08_00460 [Apibacter muscae]|uniref:hypothetical protein n=1 Tax=Apibacter muscae TaxID=2509004 RepID=UPI0011ACF443|nr:hypothetical protein [Apibacter muscae]TWP31710.1 hypothetical protein ETU08_00460 [Apibacter muscae]
MKSNIKLNEKECTEISTKLSFVIGSIDRVGSGFYGDEETALALLLCFKENKMLDILSNIRRIFDISLEKHLSEDEFEKFMEKEIEVWKPPYNATKEELLKLLQEC